MIRWHPEYFFILGFILVVIGVALPFMMVIQVIESTFFLNFFAFTASLVGMFLGVIGVAYYVRNR
jgi:hypothetical protein